MPERSRPYITVPDRLFESEQSSWLRTLIENMTTQIQAAETRVLQDKRFSDQRTAKALRMMEGEVSLDKAVRTSAPAVLALVDEYNAVWLPFDGSSGPTGGTLPPIPPVDASYIVVALSSDLTSERRLQAEASVLALVDGGANGDITVAVLSNGITNTKLRQGVATSVIGRSANSTGNVADIAAANDHEVLTRQGSALVWQKRTDSILVTNNQWRSCGGVPCVQAQVGTSPDLYDCWDFTSATDSEISAAVIVPTDWGSGNITAKVKWATAGAVAATTWAPEIRYLSAADGADLTGAGTTINAGAIGTNIAANLVQTTTVGTITPAAAGRTLRLVMRRILGDANDTYTGSIRFIEAVLEYQPTF